MKKILLVMLAASLSMATVNLATAQESKCKKECCKDKEKCKDKDHKDCSKKCDAKAAKDKKKSVKA